MSSDYITRICKDCSHEFPLTDEFWHRREKGKYRWNCKTCERARVRAWAKENPDKVKARKIDKEANNRRVIKWKKGNPELHRAQLKRHSQRHPEVYMKSKHTYRAKEAGVKGTFTEVEVMSLFREQAGYCFHCGVDLIPIGFHRDHWIPLSRGGSNWISNIRLLCPFCNFSKHDRLPCEWHPERYDKNQMPI